MAQPGESTVDGSGVALGAIPLVVATEPASGEPAPRRLRLWRLRLLPVRVPRIVDYLIVAIFMFFVF